MEIIKTKNGEFRFKEKVYLPDGSTRSKTFHRKTDALRWKQDTESQKRRDPSELLRVHRNLRLCDLYEIWMTTQMRSKRDERTVYQYERFYRAHFEKRFGSKLIDSFTSADFDLLCKQLLDRGMKEKSVNNVLTFIKQVFRYASVEGYLKEDPLLKIRKLSEPQRDFKYLRKEEIQVLLRVNRFESIYPVLVIALNTGMRIGEIFGLCWDCVSFESNNILVKRSLSRTRLKEKTKTKLIRAIPMNDAVQATMRKLVAHQTSNKYVLADAQGNPLRPDHYSSRDFKRALERADLKSMRFHDLRHTYASNYMMSGGNLYDLQKILGHTKSDTTNMYAHLSPAHLQTAVRVVNFCIESESAKECSPNLALLNR